MTPLGLVAASGAIGPTGFSFLVWGAIVLVAMAFGYIVWTLIIDRSRR